MRLLKLPPNRYVLRFSDKIYSDNMIVYKLQNLNVDLKKIFPNFYKIKDQNPLSIYANFLDFFFTEVSVLLKNGVIVDIMVTAKVDVLDYGKPDSIDVVNHVDVDEYPYDAVFYRTYRMSNGFVLQFEIPGKLPVIYRPMTP